MVLVVAFLWVLCLLAPCFGHAADADGSHGRADELRRMLAHHDELYFRRAAPEISDAEYDALRRELDALERRGNEDAPDPPPVGDDRSGRFQTAAHREPMLGLEKAYAETELRSFFDRIGALPGRVLVPCVAEPKYDGVAISVTFENGRLLRALTRGNGSEGEDVTANVARISGLPHAFRPRDAEGRVGHFPRLVELRGEVYLPLDAFDRANADRTDEGGEPFAHPRNVAAATLKAAVPDEISDRGLAIVFFGWGDWQPAKTRPASQSEFVAFLRDWGLPAVEQGSLVSSFDEARTAIASLYLRRKTLGFPIDGVVLKANLTADRDLLGANRQAPRWAIAWKFAAERARTVVRNIVVQVGRTGVLTPVAEVVPVVVGGSTVSRVTLHNRNEIFRLDIRVGDRVEVERAGEVIPAIVRVDASQRPLDSAPYHFPGECPACGSPAASIPGEAAVYCPNANCGGQIRRRIAHYASRRAADIKGLGPATIDALVESGLVHSPADLYALGVSELREKGGLTTATAERLIAEIDRSLEVPLRRVLFGIGIRGIGESASESIASAFGTLDALLAAADPDEGSGMAHAALEKLSPSVAASLRAFLRSVENQKMLARLKAVRERRSRDEGVPLTPISL